MENNIKVSIVVPAYNVENYIEDCLKSLISQTLKEIEIIVVNDGSTDKTPEIITKYADLDSRIKVINQENQGISITRNNGIDSAKGEYIGFVDSDDWVDENYFEELYNTAKKFDADLSVASILKHKPNYNKYSLQYKKQTCAEKTQDKIKICQDKKKRFFYVWHKLGKADLIRKNNIKFPAGRIYEDVHFSMKVVHFANKIVSVTNTNYHYLQRENSIINTKKKTEKHRNDQVLAYKELQKFAYENKIKLPDRLNYYQSIWVNPLIKAYIGEYKKTYKLFGIIPIFVVKSSYETKWNS